MNAWLERQVSMYALKPVEVTLELRLHHQRVSAEDVATLRVRSAQAQQQAAMFERQRQISEAADIQHEERIASFNAQLASMGASPISSSSSGSSQAINPWLVQVAAYTWIAWVCEHQGDPPFRPESRHLATEILRGNRPTKDAIDLVIEHHPEAELLRELMSGTFDVLDFSKSILDPIAQLFGRSSFSLTDYILMPWVIVAAPRTELYPWMVWRAPNDERIAALRRAFEAALEEALWLAHRGDASAQEHLRHAVLIAEQTPEPDDDIMAMNVALEMLGSPPEPARFQEIGQRLEAMTRSEQLAPGALQLVTTLELIELKDDGLAAGFDLRGLSEAVRGYAERLLTGGTLERGRWVQWASACVAFDALHGHRDRARLLLEALDRGYGPNEPLCRGAHEAFEQSTVDLQQARMLRDVTKAQEELARSMMSASIDERIAGLERLLELQTELANSGEPGDIARQAVGDTKSMLADLLEQEGQLDRAREYRSALEPAP